ncbi:MAG TPA: hypothetical protein VMO26_10115 [Vicinamibacterales bacterium]|nr:hypothetical protein [Vicinamibacterales bacterium]
MVCKGPVFLVALIGLIAAPSIYAQPLMTTFAGNGIPPANGLSCLNDAGRVATTACLGDVWGVAFDPSGNLIVVSRDTIFTIDPAGVIIRLATLPHGMYAGGSDAAGNPLFIRSNALYRLNVDGTTTRLAGGTHGHCGDGGPALSACFYMAGLAADRLGNVFIADGYNNRIRKIDTNGIVSTVAGNGVGGACGDGGPATSACVAHPQTVAVDDNGNLFIADATGRVRKVDASGIITSILIVPRIVRGLAADAHGNVFASETYQHRVLRIGADGDVTVYAGTGRRGPTGDGAAATAARLNRPRALAIDAEDGLYIYDSDNSRVRKVDTAAVLSLKESANCKTTGRVTLAEAAPAEGLVVHLASDNSNAQLPATITLKPGARTKTFPVTMTPVTTRQLAHITWHYGDVTRTSAWTVGPPRPMSLTFEPNPAIRGATATGEVTLYCPATDASVVTLFAEDDFRGTFPPTVTIPIGQSNTSFSVSVGDTPKGKHRFLAVANGGVVTEMMRVKRP